jgi:hypothetical protein
MQTIDKQPDREVQSLYFLRDIRTYAAQLRASHFGPYSEPQKLLLLTQWEDSSVADEIAASTPSEQRFVCPVDILWEVTTTIAIVTPATVAPLRLSLCEGTRRGARVISRRWLPDASWISVNLDAPLAGCTNGVLKLRVESRHLAPPVCRRGCMRRTLTASSDMAALLSHRGQSAWP